MGVTSTAKKVLQAALLLSDDEREDLVAALSDSLHPVDLSDEWSAEVGSRIAEIESGSVELVAGAEVARIIEKSLANE